MLQIRFQFLDFGLLLPQRFLNLFLLQIFLLLQLNLLLQFLLLKSKLLPLLRCLLLLFNFVEFLLQLHHPLLILFLHLLQQVTLQLRLGLLKLLQQQFFVPHLPIQSLDRLLILLQLHFIHHLTLPIFTIPQLLLIVVEVNLHRILLIWYFSAISSILVGGVLILKQARHLVPQVV